MMRTFLKACFVLPGMMFFLTINAQSSGYRLYKFADSVIVGYELISMETVPEKPLERINKVIRRNLFEEEKPIVYSNSSVGNYCVSFMNKDYELIFVIISSTGDIEHSIVFINPEYNEFSAIYDHMSDSGYSFQAINSPFGPIRKNISPSKTWYEAYPGKQGNDIFETVVIFNDKFQQIAIEKDD